MILYRRAGRPSFYLGIPTQAGLWVKRSSGTDHRPTAKAIGRMVEALRQERAWDLLGAVAEGSLALGSLYDAYRYADLDGLRLRRADVDLSEHIDGWARWLTTRVTTRTSREYVAQVRTLMPEDPPFLRSSLTGPVVTRWLSALEVTGATQRHYFAALHSFVKYLRQLGVVTDNPLADVTLARAGRPRGVFLELPSVLQLVEGSPQPFKAVLALAYGAGIEISAILSLVEGDVDRARKATRARGTKAWTRDRISYIADWAWPHIEQHLETVLPGERLFRGMDRWQVGDHHRERCRVLGLEGYRLHDSRHHWAVEQLRAGTPVELVSKQLGHVDAVMCLRIYGKFVPGGQEWDHWRAKVRAAQHEKWGVFGTKGGTDAKPAAPSETDEAAVTFDGADPYGEGWRPPNATRPRMSSPGARVASEAGSWRGT
jgi:integrase